MFSKKFIYSLFFHQIMDFNQNKVVTKFGECIGYICSYFLFTTILFFIIDLTGHIGSWTYFHIMALTIFIVFVGFLLKKVLN